MLNNVEQLILKGMDLTGDFISKKMNFEVEKDSVSIFIFQKEEEGSEFLKIITGMKKPKTGEVFLLGRKLSELTRNEIFELRKKTGIVFKTGGLISNLRVWENIVFPALYHKISDEKIIEKQGMQLLKEFEFKKEPMASIAELTIFEKRLVGLVRALLIKPEVLILEYPFEGISESERAWFAEKIKKLSSTVLYILSSEMDIIKNANN